MKRNTIEVIVRNIAISRYIIKIPKYILRVEYIPKMIIE